MKTAMLLDVELMMRCSQKTGDDVQLFAEVLARPRYLYKSIEQCKPPT